MGEVEGEVVGGRKTSKHRNLHDRVEALEKRIDFPVGPNTVCIIDSSRNGWRVWQKADDWYSEDFSCREECTIEKASVLRDVLYEVKDAICHMEEMSRYSPARVKFMVEPGDKYEYPMNKRERARILVKLRKANGEV